MPVSGTADCVLVGVDGVDGAGKTVLADELAAVLRQQGRAVVRISVDSFHRPRAERHRLGRDSPSGFWLDSFDYDRLRADVLEPLGPGGGRRFRRAAHHLRTDAVLEPAWEQAPPGAVVVVDGLFLHRDELAGWWAFSLWLDVPFEVSVDRMAARDGSVADPSHPSLRRYVEGQRLYLAACDPAARASVVLDNTILERPVLRRTSGGQSAVGGAGNDHDGTGRSAYEA